jgi:hypothetical protein
MIIGTVVEGPTDRILLEAVLQRLIPGEHRFLPLQPPVTFGELGAGWKGVRRWCRQTWQREGLNLAATLASGPPLDLLVIHLDADVARESDLQEGEADPIDGVVQPCPPASATAARLTAVVCRSLQVDSLPPVLVLAIPAQDTESWSFAALHPGDDLCARADCECIRSGRDHPAYRLTLKRYGKLLQRRDGEIKKAERRYREVAPHIAAAWETVCRLCPQAAQFTQDIQTVCAAAGHGKRTQSAVSDVQQDLYGAKP